MKYRNIDDIITEYLAAKQQQRDAEKRAKALQAAILDHAGVMDASETASFTTSTWTVYVEPKSRTGLDADALRKDFPDIVDAYGKTSTWSQVTVKAAVSGKKTA